MDSCKDESFTGQLKDLERRVDDLNALVIGQNGKDNVNVDEISSRLSAFTQIIVGTEKSKPTLRELFALIPVLEFMLDPNYVDNSLLSGNAKFMIVQAEEERMRKNIESLQAIEKSKDILDSEHIKAARNDLPKLQPLGIAVAEQLDSSNELTVKVRNMVQEYNTTIRLISEQFIVWDDLLSKHEAIRELQRTEDTCR